MILKHDVEINNEAVIINLKRLMNQVYKLLPIREEHGDWIKTSHIVLEEFYGMYELLLDHQELIFKLLCKLEGLQSLQKEDQFMEYRAVVFECCGIISQLISLCQ